MTTAYLLLVTVLTVTLFVGPGLGDDGVIQGQKPEYDESETYFDGVEGEDELISSDDLTIESINSRSISCPQGKGCVKKGGFCTKVTCMFGTLGRCSKGCNCCKIPDRPTLEEKCTNSHNITLCEEACYIREQECLNQIGISTVICIAGYKGCIAACGKVTGDRDCWEQGNINERDLLWELMPLVLLQHFKDNPSENECTRLNPPGFWIPFYLNSPPCPSGSVQTNISRPGGICCQVADGIEPFPGFCGKEGCEQGFVGGRRTGCPKGSVVIDCPINFAIAEPTPPCCEWEG